jgi:hypothetical protein
VCICVLWVHEIIHLPFDCDFVGKYFVDMKVTVPSKDAQNDEVAIILLEVITNLLVICYICEY